MKLNQLIITIGLFLDILGAIFLAKGFMAKKIQRIINESLTYVGRNKWFRDSLVQQKIEAWIGLIFLFLGFMLQAIGNFISSPKRINISTFVILLSIIFILILLFFILLKLIKYLTNRSIIEIEAIYYKDKLDTYKTGSLNYCGECLNILREKNEGDDEYKKRIKKRISKILKEK